MKRIKSFVIFAVLITLIISAHEAGHMFTAQAFGVTVDKFGIGFGEPLISWNIGDVEYSINPILFGGYVKVNQQSLAEASLVAKILISAAGPFVNLLLFIFSLTLYKNSLFESRNLKTKKKLPAAKQYFIVLWITLKKLGYYFRCIFKVLKEGGAESVRSPLGILEESYDVARKKIKKKWKDFVIEFSVYNSIFFLLNLIPIPAFDGGRIGITILEAIFGPSPIYSKLILGSFILLIGLAILLTARDLLRIIKRVVNNPKRKN